jgi:hypothetical protein
MRFAIALVCMASLAGCAELAPVTAPVPAGRTLLVRYASPTKVTFIALGDTGRMVLIRELRGRSVSDSGHTIRALVTGGWGAEWEYVPEGSIAIVKLGPGVRVETTNFNFGKTLELVGVTLAVGLIATFFYLLVNLPET